MNSKKYKTFNISMAIITVLNILISFGIKGSGILDINKIIQFIIDTIAVTTCVLFLVTYRKAWNED